MKVVSVVGARPQFIKAAMVNRALAGYNAEGHSPKIEEFLLHTGQHYDLNMSQVFFDKMNIPQPHLNLEVGSGPHGEMTGTMLMKIEGVLAEEVPDWVVVYGDTNSTLAGALAAAKLQIPVAHVEAGLRSYNRRMPEEINRVLTDRLSSLLFCPTRASMTNLAKEGMTQGVFEVGDVMYDAFLAFKDVAMKESSILSELELEPGQYCLATVHRQENTDDLRRLSSIFRAFAELSDADRPFVIPLHPRTQKVLQDNSVDIEDDAHLWVISPVDYLDMIALESQARLILTDSGGVQKESLFAGVPCITLRDETEWVETLEAGWNQLAGANTEQIVEAFKNAIELDLSSPPDLYGDGKASQAIVQHLIAALSS
jgi:UDP-GlcNAc3NAcA epimerase